MSRYRLLPTPTQEAVLRSHCSHARYIWNLAVEQHAHRFPGRKAAPDCLNRGILASGWGLLARRLRDKAAGRVEKVSPAYTSQRCSACGHIAAESRKSQALFACVACSFACNADVNAARNIAAGHAVTARGGDGAARPVNREPQLLLLPA
jgi:putative transposase